MLIFQLAQENGFNGPIKYEWMIQTFHKSKSQRQENRIEYLDLWNRCHHLLLLTISIFPKPSTSFNLLLTLHLAYIHFDSSEDE